MNEEIKYIIESIKTEMKERDKERRVDWLVYNVYPIAEYYVTQGFSYKNKQLTEQLLRALDNKKFAKALLTLVSEDIESVPTSLILLTSKIVDEKLSKDPNAIEVLKDPETGDTSIEINDKVLELYSKVNDKLLKKPTKQLSNNTGISKELAMRILTELPSAELISKEHLVRVYLTNVNRAILKYYANSWSKDSGEELITPDQLKKVYKNLFGKDNLPHIYRALATENVSLFKVAGEHPATQVISVNNAIQYVLLGFLEGNKKKFIREFVRDFLKTVNRDRKKGKNYKRRLNVVNANEFPKVSRILEDESDSYDE